MEKQQTDKGFSIYHDFVIHASAKAVFDAITQPKHLNNWWPLTSSGTPEVGEVYNFNFTDAYNWYGKVTVCKNDTSFHIKMTDADPDWNPTTFGFDLKEDNHSVAVQFSHTRWPVCNHHFKRSSFCWAMLLNGLKNYVEKGTIIPFEERE